MTLREAKRRCLHCQIKLEFIRSLFIVFRNRVKRLAADSNGEDNGILGSFEGCSTLP